MERRLAIHLPVTVALLIASGTLGAAAAETVEPDPSEDAAELPPIVAEFEAAFETGELEPVQELFTEDGILTTTGNVHELYWGWDFHRGTWDKYGGEFRRLTSIHGGDLAIDDVIQAGGNLVMFRWDWEDFADGTALLELRNGRIAVAILAVAGGYIPEHRVD